MSEPSTIAGRLLLKDWDDIPVENRPLIIRQVEEEASGQDQLVLYLDRVKRAYDTGEITHGEAVAEANAILGARNDGA